MVSIQVLCSNSSYFTDTKESKPNNFWNFSSLFLELFNDSVPHVYVTYRRNDWIIMNGEKERSREEAVLSSLNICMQKFIEQKYLIL